MNNTSFNNVKQQSLLQQSNNVDSKNYIDNIVDNAINMFPTFTVGIIVIILSVFIANWIKKYIENLFLKTGLKLEAKQIIGKALYTIIILIGVATSLEIIGLNTTFILSALGFGLGFAFKDILSNYIAGMFLIFSDTFKLGDLMNINGHIGTVEEIGYRNIIIRNLDGNKIFVPNSLLINSTFTNFTYYPERRLNVPISISYNEDLHKASKAVLTAVSSHPKVLKKPEPIIIYKEFSNYSIILEARFWINSRDNFYIITSEIITDIKFIFDKLNIKIPFPITTIHVDKRNNNAPIEVINLDNINKT